ncbi:hypothetical protein [Streptomyces djakartensis]|uniref:hypothetical protein n=1 Tax=Streptomyces djakartensis TaxID=68193 RepID=UPI00167F097B|nr:hypothetical protein [Streptomyces djakartensis]
MDQIAPELLMALASGTVGAAGQQIWTSLRGLVARTPSGEEPSAENELSALDEAADDEERARELAEVLVRRAEQDPAFAQALETWRRRAEVWDDARTGAGDAHNEISGGTFHGPVVQARDITGPMHFGG